MSDPTLELFMGLFSGRKDVYGSVEGKSNKEPVTEELYRQHLEGKKSLGVYPLLDDATCNFFAVDIDKTVRNFDFFARQTDDSFDIALVCWITGIVDDDNIAAIRI